MKILLGCVNSTVSLVGFDLVTKTPFWYCPGNRLRVCGIHATPEGLWVASDNSVKFVGANGIREVPLPGPHDNYAHSVKSFGQNGIGVADTGNSRILVYSDGRLVMSYDPLECWNSRVQDAIHLNDMIEWKDGILASAFSHQPFEIWKKTCPTWQSEGLGVLFYMRRHNRQTITKVVGSGLNCPHSLALHNGDIYCCSSSTGMFYRLHEAENGVLQLVESWHVTTSHFLRGCLRVSDGWILGGSSRRHNQQANEGGMVLFHLSDSGNISVYPVAAVGEIYDIIPWPRAIMPMVAQQILNLPNIPLEGEFPLPCSAELITAN